MEDGGSPTKEYVWELDPDAKGFPLRGELFDHFIVIDQLGEGGMGIVVSAYDPKLDRKVAIKLIRSGNDEQGLRLLREAQAMAKLSHPNVLPVFQVGVAKGRVYLAMEHVAGSTLSAWLRQRPRTQHEILDAFMAAGRGLAAAHRTGLVHRDFKPDNVLVHDDGRVRVTDFGLVASTESTGSPSPPTISPSIEANDGQLTRTGAIMGTPLYMAPEQHRRKAVSGRTDQYAFCVALYEALHGEHPFGGRDEVPHVLVERVLAGRLRHDAPAGVPSWLRAVILRGMRVDPDERFADMETLLDALARDPAVRWRQIALWLGAAAAVALGVVGITRGMTASAQACAAGAERVEGAWGAAARDAVRAAFIKTGRPYAEDTFARTATALDRYGAGWAAARDEACREAPSSRLRDLRLACLDRRRGELAALVTVFRDADVEVLHRAVTAAQALPTLAACADDAALLGAMPVPDDPAARARVEEVRARIAAGQALGRAGRFKEGLERSRGLSADAESTGWTPVRAEALSLLADLQAAAGDYKTAEKTLGDGRAAAAAARDDALAAHIWVSLLSVIGMSQERLPDARLLEPAAEAAVVRAGDPPAQRVELLDVVGKLYEIASRYDDAGQSYERALAIADKALPADDARTTTTLIGLGMIAFRRNHTADARRYYERALEINRRTVGEEHPAIAVLYSRMALVLQAEGKLEESLPLSQRAVDIQEKTLGPDHPELAETLNNLGNVYLRLGRYEQALALYRRAQELRLKTLGPDHPHVAVSFNNIAQAQVALGRLDEARPLLERSLAIKIKAYGPDNQDVADSLLSLAEIDCIEGKWSDALELNQRGLAVLVNAIGPENPASLEAELQRGVIYDNLGRPEMARPLIEHVLAGRAKLLGPEHPETAQARAFLAENRVLAGDARAAVLLAEHALAAELTAAQVAPQGAVGEARWALARALATRSADAERATQMARRALADFEAVGPMNRHRAAAVREWLRGR